FRILSYAPRRNYRLVQFFVFAVMAVLFNAAYLGLLQPLMDILFGESKIEAIPYPEFSFSIEFIKAYFKYHFMNVFAEYGPQRALGFVCALIVGFLLLSNTFRYLERVAASRLKV